MKDMLLEKIEQYDEITIQCHDNPDADTIASGYALYCYYKDKGKKVKMVYGGRNRVTKPNLIKFLEYLGNPLKYYDTEKNKKKINGVLVTIDCQYGAGNVTHIEADNIVIIDHHEIEIDNIKDSLIRSELGSCATLVWDMLTRSDYNVNDNIKLSTALYYGLYTDSNQLLEIFNPLDKDAEEQLVYERNIITMLRNSNLSLRELEVSGIAMLRNSFNEDYGFSVIRTEECDPNILGLIADFLLQVDKINVCVVFNENSDGYKLSVRSCMKDVAADELAAYLTEGIGSGGGHKEKAGGFVSKKLYHDRYPGFHGEAYISSRLIQYFESYEVINAEDYRIDVSDMDIYEKIPLPIGYVKMTDMLPAGTPILVRTMECDMDIIVQDDIYMMIGIKGEVYPVTKDKFEIKNKPLNKKYSYDKCVIENVYTPTVKNKLTGEVLKLAEYAYMCEPSGMVKIYAKQLKKTMKVFTQWDKEAYMLGKPGDYIAAREEDLHDIYIIEKNVFSKTYKKVK